MTSTLLEVEGLALSRGAPGVRQAFSFRSPAGWLAVVGGNGVGKSTLLLSLAGLIGRPSSCVALATADGGTVALTRLDRLSNRRRARAIAWMGQSEVVEGRWLARDLIALGRLPWRDQARVRDESSTAFSFAPGRAVAPEPAGSDSNPSTTGHDDWVQALALEPLWNRPFDSLSGGERQRVLIGRALAVNARVTLLDEPSLHLDPLHQYQFACWLAASRSRGRLVVTATHDLNFALNADAILLLSQKALPLYANSQDQGLHRAIESEMAGALLIRRVSLTGRDHWFALPRPTIIQIEQPLESEI